MVPRRPQRFATRFRLRTLLIVLAIGPMVLAEVWLLGWPLGIILAAVALSLVFASAVGFILALTIHVSERIIERYGLRVGGKSMFRFSIRDVLWLTTVVAIAAAWRADRYFLVEAYRGARTGYISEYSYANRLSYILDQMGQKPPPRLHQDVKEAAEQAALETPKHTRMFK